MKYTLPFLLATSMLSLGSLAHGQTIATFDDLNLPAADTNFASTLPPDSAYNFRSGDIVFYGSSNSWGSFSGFNYSNITDNTDPSYTNDKSAITGIGADSSDNYAIDFVTIDFANTEDPTATIPSGIGLTGNASGHPVLGAYFTNTTYAYYYMQDHFQASDWFKLTVRGYLNGQQSDNTVDFMLADTGNVLVDTWQWIDLTTLGNVDSLTFDLSSSDTSGGFGMNNPAYFAMDNLTTSGETAIHPAIHSLTLTVSPNPANNYLHINAEMPVNVSVYSLQGQLVIQKNKAGILDISGLTPGIYFLKVMDTRSLKTALIRFSKL